MRYFYFLFLILSFCNLGCTSVSRESFSSDKDPNVNFLNYSSFTWLPKDSGQIYNTLYDNQIVEGNIIAYANEALEKHGYQYTSQQPDLLLKYTFLIESKSQTINYPIYSNVPYPNQVNYVPYNPNLTNGLYYNNPGVNPYSQNSPYNINYYANNYPYNNGYGYPAGSIAGYPNGYGLPSSSASYMVGTGFQQIEFKEGTLIIDAFDSKTKRLIWRGWSSEPLSDPETFEKRLPFEINGIFSRFPGRSAESESKK